MSAAGDEAREIARELRSEAALAGRSSQWSRLTRLAVRLDSYADSIDDTIAVLGQRYMKAEATPWEAPDPNALIEFEEQKDG